MTVSYNLPGINLIKNDFATFKDVDQWLPGLFEQQIINGLFPVDSSGNLNEKTEFSKSKTNIDDFTISLKRYFLFLYCLKSRPYLFEDVSKVINYKNDEFLFIPELAGYLSQIQTNKIKNPINSSLTIELVKKYAIDKGLDFFPQKLSDYFDVANTDDFINTVSRTLNTILYESVIKHTLYENLKGTSFNFKEGNAAGWIQKATKLSSGDFDYFIDVEGGPDNKSYPVVCVLTKRFNEDTKEKILEQSNSFLSNIFGKKVGNECLSTVIGNPGAFEDNLKLFPILKSRKDEKNFYNAVCVIYDFSKIIFSQTIGRNFDTQSVLEIALGFFTRYSIEVNNIDDLTIKSNNLSNFLENYFTEDSFSDVEYYVASKNKHVEEIYSRINIQNKGEIETALSQPIKIKRGNLSNSFFDYVNLLINTYKEARKQNTYLAAYDSSDLRVTLHFDSFLNLLAITAIPKDKKITDSTKQYSPFQIETFNNFGLGEKDQKYISEEFYGKYLNLTNDLIDYSGRRICVATKTLERMVYNNFDKTGDGYLIAKDLTSNVVEKNYVDLITKINTTLPKANFNYTKDNLFINEKLIDKSIKIISLSTNYRENKYQSVALQTMAFYLINAQFGSSLLENDNDLKKFGEIFHYPVLSMAAANSKKEFTIGELTSLSDFEIPQEIFLVSTEIQKTFDFIKGNQFSTNEFVRDASSLFVSSLPCYADIIYVIDNFKNIDDVYDLIEALSIVFRKLPISEIISELLAKLLNHLGILENQKDPCKPLPSKFPTLPDELFSAIEFLKDIYSRSLDPRGLVIGFVDEFPRIDTLDFWFSLIVKIGSFLLKLAADWLLRKIFDYIRPYLEKLCSLDFELFKPPFFDNEQSENNQFSPSIAADSFGSPAESDSNLYDVQLAIDINVLIDLSEIVSRQVVYSKFADEYSLEKSQTIFSEISKFLSDISYSIDLYELASLLRGVATESTISSIIDAISLTDASFKKLFTESDDIIKLFVFLSNYCDYRICYDILGRSLEKYVGNICTPQQSRKRDYELIIKDMGADPAATVRDQILDLEKQFDQLCSTNINLNIDVFRDGPKLLANYLTQFMVMPFGAVIEFQQNVYKYENGVGMTKEQKALLSENIFSVFDLSNVGKISEDNFSLMREKNSIIFIQAKIANNYKTIQNITNFLLSVPNSDLSIYVNEQLKKVTSFYKSKKIKIDEEVLKKNIVDKKIINLILSANRVYNKISYDSSKEAFSKNYQNIVYSTNYLEKLKDQIKEEIENSNNSDVQDDQETFNSYINKLKEYSEGK